MTRPAYLPQRVAILGFARSGEALARALLERRVEVAVGDRRPESDFPAAAEVEALGARFFFGGPSLDLLDGAGWLALSPGVPASGPVPREARRRGLPVLSEFEIAWRIAQAQARGKNRWVAVTGTNGKSTTTAWIADILTRAGRPVALAGNIGVPLSAFLRENAPRDFVCELSSFQLETVDRFAPDVAVLTNVTPDHLDRYPDFEAYARAKERVFARQDPEDAAVVNADDPVAWRLQTPARRIGFSRARRIEGGAWIEGGMLFSAARGVEHAILPTGRVGLAGAHNLENALAAAAAADCLAAPVEAVAEGLERFPGLPHRMERVAEAAGVAWVNDSKGTNVDATRKSLEGYPAGSVVLILGGRDKHGDFAALAPAVSRAARRVLTIGEAAGDIERALEGAAPVERAETLPRAVRRAAELARPGDTVLLSPACASFDQYANYEERGRHFAELARKTADGKHGS